MHAKKTAFVVEHDFIMATYLADRYVLALSTVLTLLKYIVSSYNLYSVKVVLITIN